MNEADPGALGLDILFDVFLGADEHDVPKPHRRRGRGLGQKAKNIRAAVLDDLVHRHRRMTVRQVFYACEIQGIVPKTEGGYGSVQRQLAAMRREGILDWGFIADGTRWVRQQNMWDDKASFLQDVQASYRRNLWRGQGARIEIWLEKDALAEIVLQATSKWRVPLMVSRGQSSVTYLNSAAREARGAYEHDGTQTWVYALYDHDMGGARASEAIARDLPRFARVPIHFERLAITPAQIAAYSLPTRPPKKSDPQAAQWGNKPAVELDAMPPNLLVPLVETAIARHINHREWDIEREIEQQEVADLRDLIEGWKQDEDGPPE